MTSKEQCILDIGYIIVIVVVIVVIIVVVVISSGIIIIRRSIIYRTATIYKWYRFRVGCPIPPMFIDRDQITGRGKRKQIKVIKQRYMGYGII